MDVSIKPMLASKTNESCSFRTHGEFNNAAFLLESYYSTTQVSQCSDSLKIVKKYCVIILKSTTSNFVVELDTPNINPG